MSAQTGARPSIVSELRWATCLDDGSKVPRGGLYQFVVEGRVVPYVRMTQRSKYVDDQAKRYLAWQNLARLRMREQMNLKRWNMIPKRTPFAVRMYFVPPDHRHDLDNAVKAAMDAAQGVVYPDDRWAESIAASRATGGPARLVMYVRWPA